jgi:hypothetical protein
MLPLPLPLPLPPQARSEAPMPASLLIDQHGRPYTLIPGDARAVDIGSTDDQLGTASFVYVNDAGNVDVVVRLRNHTDDSQKVKFTVAGPGWLDVAVTKVFKTNTTATSMVACAIA